MRYTFAIALLAVASCSSEEHEAAPEPVEETATPILDLRADEASSDGSPVAASPELESAPEPVPRVRAQRATIVGQLDATIVRRFMRQQLVVFRACYKRELLQSPALAGTMTLRFVITVNGKPQAVRATGLGKAVGSCVVKQVTAMEFPHGNWDGTVLVTYPLVFSLQ